MGSPPIFDEMTVLLYALLALFGFAALFGLYDYCKQRNGRADGETAEPETPQPPRAACGLTDVCTMHCALAAPQEPAEYYDDEELDAFKGVRSDQYTSEQTAAFEEVLDTMLKTDVHGWLRSLHKRGIQLPASLKPKALAIVREVTPAHAQ